MLWRTLVLVAMGLSLSPPAIAARLTFEDYWNEASHKPGAVTKEYPHAIVITDKKDFTVYIFTKPNTPAHPGVIIRKLVNENGGAYFDTEGHSDGPDSAQPAFKAWMDNPFQ
jgi:hypothetical protein